MRIEVPSLLITDDDRDFRETLRDALTPRGFRALVAGDGQEALDIIQRECVHLLLLDMHMPRLTGLETIRRVKQIDVTLPCILMSAAVDDRLAEEARQAQAYWVLSKPVLFHEVTRIVCSALHATYDWPAADACRR